MPPKDSKSAKKKGNKPSKAEKEKLQREADERRQREEEEARLFAEHEEQERLERERRVQEEQLRLELKDSERREDELTELCHLLEENHIAVTKWKGEHKEKAKWDRYMRCDGSPDPSVPHEINTFISLWREDPEVKIGLVLKDCALALELIEELENWVEESTQSEENERDTRQHQDTLQALQSLIHSKLNQATEEILKMGTMQTVIQDKNVMLCLWANPKKNARFKGFEFQEVGLGFELPKQLALCEIAVRILHTRYDHLSHLGRGLCPAARKGKAVRVGVEEEEEDRRKSLQVGEEELQTLPLERMKSAISTTSEREERTSTAHKETEEEEETKGKNLLEEPFTGNTLVALSADEEDPSSSQRPVIDTVDETVVDLYQYTPLGGVFYFNVFRLPPQSQLVNGWEMRELLETGLQDFPYPVDQYQPQSSESGKPDESSMPTSPPVGVTVTLPESVMFLEKPQVARWDTAGCQWRKDLIGEVTYDESSRRISFQMESFYPFTLMQDTYVNMPFQSWELRPLGPDSAVLTVVAAVTEVSITVKNDCCMLTSAPGSELSHVSGKWMSPFALQKTMRAAGVNIFVDQFSDMYVSVNAKDPATERVLYEQMALLSSTFAFSWSRWNSHCGPDNLVLQACAHPEAGPVPEGAWSLYLVGAKRSQRLHMKERSEAFSPELAEGSEYHSTFLHMLRDVPGGRGESQPHHLFIDCIHQLLYATRVLTFS